MSKLDRDLLHLFPRVRSRVADLLLGWNKLNPSEPVGLMEGLRSFERQAELYAIGRTVDGAPCVHNKVIRPLGTCALHPRGRVVTNAPAGMSWHQYGLAVDIVFDSDPVKPDLQATYDGDLPWMQMGKFGQDLGLEWAGAWKNFPEYPHFQLTFGMQLVEAHALFEQGGLTAVWKGVTNEILTAG